MLARRRALSAPAVRPARSDLLGVSQAPPPLYIPSVPRSVITPPVDAPPPATSAPPAPEVHPAQEPSPVPALPPPSYDLPPTPPAPQRTSSGAILVVDASQPPPSADRDAPHGASRYLSHRRATTRRRPAEPMSNRCTTAPQTQDKVT